MGGHVGPVDCVKGGAVFEAIEYDLDGAEITIYTGGTCEVKTETFKDKTCYDGECTPFRTCVRWEWFC